MIDDVNCMHKGQLQEAASQGYGLFPPALFGTMAYCLIIPGVGGVGGMVSAASLLQ